MPRNPFRCCFRSALLVRRIEGHGLWPLLPSVSHVQWWQAQLFWLGVWRRSDVSSLWTSSPLTVQGKYILGQLDARTLSSTRSEDQGDAPLCVQDRRPSASSYPVPEIILTLSVTSLPPSLVKRHDGQPEFNSKHDCWHLSQWGALPVAAIVQRAPWMGYRWEELGASGPGDATLWGCTSFSLTNTLFSGVGPVGPGTAQSVHCQDPLPRVRIPDLPRLWLIWVVNVWLPLPCWPPTRGWSLCYLHNKSSKWRWMDLTLSLIKGRVVVSTVPGQQQRGGSVSAGWCWESMTQQSTGIRSGRGS